MQKDIRKVVGKGSRCLSLPATSGKVFCTTVPQFKFLMHARKILRAVFTPILCLSYALFMDEALPSWHRDAIRDAGASHKSSLSDLLMAARKIMRWTQRPRMSICALNSFQPAVIFNGNIKNLV